MDQENSPNSWRKGENEGVIKSARRQREPERERERKRAHRRDKRAYPLAHFTNLLVLLLRALQ